MLVRCFYGADFVKGVPQGSYPFSHPSVSLFDLAGVSSPRPTHRVAGARRSGQSWPVHRAATDRLGLDGFEHDGILVVVGMTTSEGSSHVVHEHSRHILLFGGEDPDHDAVMRIGSESSEAADPFWGTAFEAMQRTGTPPLEPSSATRHERADRAETVGCSVTASLPSVCGTEDDALGHDAVAHEVPQGDEQLAGQGDDHLLAPWS